MIIVTGAAGFIGSCLAKDLKEIYDGRIVIVDDFSVTSKSSNLEAISDLERVDRSVFFPWLQDRSDVEAIFHIGARTDTTEFDYSIFERLNVDFTQKVWNYCSDNNVFLVYASSAATYGDGTLGYSDQHDLVPRLKPLNPYGDSKNEFDKWALHQSKQPPNWYGLKFFNVYGPNEYHKGRMASVVYHAYKQIEQTGKMKLFRSHNPAYKDGEQQRDFIYVRDILKVINFLWKESPESGLYNLGSGRARTFLNLTNAVFRAMNKSEDIGFIDTPEDIRDKYQYHTEADMSKLRNAGYKELFTTLEEGVKDYIVNYLSKGFKNY